MTEPAQTPLSDETAMLIERAVRGELSSEQRTRLDGLIEADPLVAEELERAQNEESAMNTAAVLLNQRSDPDRMRLAIEQKLQLDQRMLRLVAGGFIVFVVVFVLIAARERWPWGMLAPMTLCLLWWLVTEKRFRSFRRSLPQGDEHIAQEFRRHLSRSRNGIVLNRAAVLVIVLAIMVSVIDHIADGAYAKAVILGAFGLLIMFRAWKTLFDRTYQQRYDQFLQGRVTIEDLFDKRAEPGGSSTE
ncbi:MAG: hypothetical protein ACF8MJ_11740 [Phycisphaerales bacterium JB050]